MIFWVIVSTMIFWVTMRELLIAAIAFLASITIMATKLEPKGYVTLPAVEQLSAVALNFRGIGKLLAIQDENLFLRAHHYLSVVTSLLNLQNSIQSQQGFIFEVRNRI